MEIIKEVRKELKSMANPKYVEFSKKITTDTNKKMTGVRVPELRKIAQKIAKQNDWKEFIKQVNENSFEEVMLQGFVIGYAKIDIDEKFEYIKKFVPQIDSWSICDTFCPTLKIKQNDLEKVWKFILPYLDSNEEFEVRFAVVMMLDYYIIDNYVDLVVQKLDKVSHTGYYVQMAVAWCLAEIGIKYNKKAMEYLRGKNNLDKFTYNKTLQKMRESYRIDAEQKEILKKMKKI